MEIVLSGIRMCLHHQNITPGMWYGALLVSSWFYVGEVCGPPSERHFTRAGINVMWDFCILDSKGGVSMHP